MTNSTLSGRWAISLADLSHILPLDSDNDGELSDAEFAKSKPLVQNYAFERLKLTSDSKDLSIERGNVDIQQNDTAIFVMLWFTVPLPGAAPDLRIDYTLFNEAESQHRGLCRLDLPGRTETTIFTRAQPSQRFLLSNAAPAEHRVGTFIADGVRHIWTGFDHILFLLALLLPSLRGGQTLRQSLLAIVKVVTAFTVAHSITLSLATIGAVTLPTRFVEPVIAASVLLAALNNLHPIFPDRTWAIAFVFGLIHGFGFATALTELHLPRNLLAIALFAFNLGVELGQLAIVLVFVPLVFALRRTAFQQLTLRYASIAICVLSSAWLVERLFDKKFLPF